MIAKPTTDQILLECCRQLSEVVLPAIDDETVKVTVMMLDLVLRNAAVRSAHEVAWMQDETDELVAFAAGVLAARPGTDGLADSMAKSTDEGAASLHLADVVERYRRASEAFSVALEAAVASDDTELVERGAAVLGRRLERETEVMSGWSPLGR